MGVEPSSPPLSPTDKISSRSNTTPHAWISSPQSLVCWCWWIPFLRFSSKSPYPNLLLLTLIISSSSFLDLSFSAASHSQLPTPTHLTSPPTLLLHINQNPKSGGLNNISTFIILFISVSVSALLLALFFMAWFWCGCFRFRISPGKNRVVCDDVDSEIGSKLGEGADDAEVIRRFSWDEVRICTKGFEKVIDSGGFSVVFYGTLTVKQPVVKDLVGAFKVHNSSERLNQGFKEELRILLKLSHPNIVKLYGYCDDQDAEQGALVFEYVPNGTLQQNLHTESVCSLPWRKRAMIAYQLALALEYLHEQCELHVVHGDIKSSNILLDSNLNVKLCDFGSAKMGFSAAIHPSRKHLITGSPGYVDPHYLRTGIASKKNDIYSFGVVVMELVTGQEAFCKETGRMLTNQFSTGSGHVDPGLVDPKLGGEFDLEEARVMCEIAGVCVRGSPSLRPSASEVIAIMRQNVRT